MKINDLLLESVSKRKTLLTKWVDGLDVNKDIVDITSLIKQEKDPKEKTKFKKLLKDCEKELSKIKPIINSETAIAKRIQKECSNYIKVYDQINNFLFRGTTNGGSIFEATSPINRHPKDSSNLLSKEYDEKLKLLGIEALRCNSTFTTGSSNQASDYGSKVYVIIPKNTAVFSWSFIYSDLVLDSTHRRALLGPRYSSKLKDVIKKELDKSDAIISKLKDENKIEEMTEKVGKIRFQNRAITRR